MKDETVKRSIFKQTTYANAYYVTGNGEIGKGMSFKELRTEVISDCSLDLPLLDKGDKFYIEEKEIVVIIESVLRTSKDNVLYIVEGNSEDDTEEEMSKSYKEAEIQCNTYKEKRRIEKEQCNYERYSKESFWFKLFHSYKNYNWMNSYK